MKQQARILNHEDQEGEGSKRSSGWLIAIVLILLLLAAILCTYLTMVVAATPAEARFYPVLVHSGRYADYSADLFGVGWEQVNPNLIAEVIRDNDPDDPDILSRITDIVNNLLTPVPRSPDAGPTDPPVRVSPTPFPATTGTPSATPTNTATFTPTATLTTTPGGTTVTPKPTNEPGPSSTPGPPTKTPVPTNTPTEAPPPTPTRTPTPQPTPTPNVCTTIRIDPISLGASDTRAKIYNNSPGVITVTRIQFVWPFENGPLTEIKLGKPKIWIGLMNPPADISSGWTGEDRTIPTGKNEELKLRYDHTNTRTGFWLRVTFQNGCRVTVEK